MDNISWHILLIDDDEEDYLLTRQMLGDSQQKKCQLKWCNSIETGWEAIQEGGYDAILMDYNLGPETSLHLISRAVATGVRAPIILFTGHTSYEIDLAAMQAGATLYLSKREANPQLLERTIRYAIERKQIADQLRASEARLRLAVRSAGLGVFDWDARTGQVVWENQQMYTIFGRSREDGPLSPQDFETNYLHPEDYPAYRAINQAHPEQSFQLAYRILHTSGSWRWVEMTGLFIFNEQGEPEHLIGVMADITERKAAEQALIEREAEQRQYVQRIQEIIDAVPGAIFLADDPECTHIYGNRAMYEMLGQPGGANVSHSAPEEERSTPWQEFKDGAPIPPGQLPMQRAGRGEHIRDYEMDVVFTKGKVTTFVCNASPLLDAEGKPSGVVAAFTDITARKQAEIEVLAKQAELAEMNRKLQENAAQLKLSHQELANFTASTSANLKQVLYEIETIANQLHTGPERPLNAQDQELLERLSRAARRTRRSLDEQQALAEIASLDWEFVPTDLGELVESIQDDLALLLEDAGAQIEVGHLPVVLADAGQMRRLLHDLITLALANHQPGTPLRVSLASEPCGEDQIAILVQANGLGFASGEESHRFERILQDRIDIDEDLPASLTICRKIAEHQGGSLTVQSTLGVGTTWIVTLPVNPQVS